jgi:hypothetical protein
MSLHELILHPADPEARLEFGLAQFVVQLREIGLIGGPTPYDREHEYVTGPRFHELIRFASWHTVVELIGSGVTLVEGPSRKSYEVCEIRVPPMADRPLVHASVTTDPPKCPRCKHEEQDWGGAIGAWWERGSSYRYACPSCGAKFAITELDWQYGCGFSRYRIEIEGVRKWEAMPSKDLLQQLRTLTETAWTYCYYRL